MALASYSPRSPKSHPRNKTIESRRRSRRVPPANVKPGKVYALPTPPSQPLSPKLHFLQTLQKTFSCLSFALVCAALGTYGWTVYAPKLWSQEYRKLEALQQHERQLTATNEILKNQLANQAEQPNSRLSQVKPSDNIFITVKPASQPSPFSKAPIIQSSPITAQPIAY